MFPFKREYQVKIIDQASLNYIEGDRSIMVSYEATIDGDCIYTSSLKRWEPPHENEPLTPEEYERVRQNLVHTLKPWWAFWMNITFSDM